MIKLHVLPQTPIRLSVKPPTSVQLHVRSAGYMVYSGDVYDGEYEIEPTFENQILQTANKTMVRDVNVLKIRVSETANPYGTTVYIGKMESI